MTSELRPLGVEERPLAYWGMLLTMAVVVTMYAALCFSYVYIRVGTTEWPPQDLPRPPLDIAAWSVVALVASAVPIWWATRQQVVGGLLALRLGLAAGLGLGCVHGVLLLTDWARTTFAVSAHAYASLFYVLPGIHLTLVAIAVLMGTVLLALSFTGEVGPERHLGMRSLALFWFVLTGGGVGLLALVYLMPHVWPVAQVGS